MKIVKYSRISAINIGDVIISDAINFANSKTTKHDIVNQDLLFETFDLEKRISDASLNTMMYKVQSRSKAMSFLVLAVKVLLFQTRDRTKFIKQIKNSDIVFIGGGNIISEVNGNDLLYRIDQIVKIAAKYKKKVIIYGVGIDSLEFSSPKKISKIINLSHYFSVRDNKSLKIVQSSSTQLNKIVDLNIDPGFLISDMEAKKEKNSKYIGVNFMNFERIVSNSKFNLSEIVENLSIIHQHYKLPLKIINTSFGEDLSLSLMIKDKLDYLKVPVEIYNIQSTKDVSVAFSDLKFFMASRMHSSIFAMSYNIPTLIFPWHSKVEYLMDLLFGNSKKNVLLNSENFDSNEIIEKINNYSSHINLEKIISAKKQIIYSDYEKVF